MKRNALMRTAASRVCGVCSSGHGSSIIQSRIRPRRQFSTGYGHRVIEPFRMSRQGGGRGVPSQYEDRNLQMRPFRVLSLDGGGLRGLLTACLIHRIESALPGFLDRVDLIAGTSGGGILALLMAVGKDPGECMKAWKEMVPRVFETTMLRSMNPFLPRYTGTAKLSFLRDELGDRRLVDLDKYVLVTAVNTQEAVRERSIYRRRAKVAHFNRSWRPAIFSNLPGCDGDVFAYEAGMRTSAAPTYFPIFQGYCDGGVICKDPSLMAVSKARAGFPRLRLLDHNIRVLSLGAGTGEHFVQEASEKIEWGLVQWSTKLIQLLMQNGSSNSEIMLTDLLGDHYHRLDPVMPDFIPFDAKDRLDDLLKLAMEVDISETVEFARVHFMSDELHTRVDVCEDDGVRVWRGGSEEELAGAQRGGVNGRVQQPRLRQQQQQQQPFSRSGGYAAASSVEKL